MRYTYTLYLLVITLVTLLAIVTLSYIYRLGGVMAKRTSPEVQESYIEQSWIVAETREGFMEVDKVLSDPRTTIEPMINSEGFME